jgi:hypothetical protein
MSMQLYDLVQPKILDERFEVRALWPFPPDGHADIRVLTSHEGGGADEVAQTLLGPEIGDGPEDSDTTSVTVRISRPKSNSVDPVPHDNETLRTSSAALPHARGGGFRVGQNVMGEAKHHAIDPLLCERAKIPEITLARNDNPRAGEPTRQHPIEVAVEVEGVHEADPVASNKPCQSPDAPGERRRLQRALPATPRLNAHFFEPRPKRPLGA